MRLEGANVSRRPALQRTLIRPALGYLAASAQLDEHRNMSGEAEGHGRLIRRVLLGLLDLEALAASAAQIQARRASS
jgi:hypothetical protein